MGGVGSGHTAAKRVWLPSTIEATGRTVCATWDPDDETWVLGVDVSCPSVWDKQSHIFTNYGAGGAWNGTTLDTAYKKSPFVYKDATQGVWLSGSNGSGGVMTRLPADAAWANVDNTRYGQVDEGGSSDPRTAGSRLGLPTGTQFFLVCSKAGGRGIAKRDTVAGAFADWAVATDRNYTAIVKSPQWSVIYGSADARGAGSTQGVFALKGLSSGSATVVQFDTVGTAAPTLADCRDIAVCSVAGKDYFYVVAGNLSGSDTEAGLWELEVALDPNDGGFVAATHLTWRKVFSVETSTDRPQSICVSQAIPGTSAPRAYLGLFASGTAATGTYTQSSGSIETYRRTHYRCMDLRAGSPTWADVSSATNVNVNTYGVDHKDHAHIITKVGEPSFEKGRIGGSNHSCQSINVNPAGDQVVTVGKSTPWICVNPFTTNASDVRWRPHSYGLGALAGGYQCKLITEHSQGWFAWTDDDRGAWLAEHGAPAVFRWSLANDVSGIAGADQATFSIEKHVLGVEIATGGLLFGGRHGRGWRVQYPFNPPAATDITFLGTGAFAEVSGTSVSVAYPAAAQEGDLLLLHGTTRNTTGAFPAITGWTQLYSRTQGSNLRSAVWYHYMVEGETAVTLVAANTGTLIGAVSGFRGVTGPVPSDTAGFDEASGTATTYQLSAPVSTVTDRAVKVNFVATADANALSMTTANSYTVMHSGAGYDSTLGTSAAMAAAYKLVTPAGASGSAPIWTQTANAAPNDAWVGAEIVLKPIGTGPSQQAILTKDYLAEYGSGDYDTIGFFSILDASANLRYIGVESGRGISRSTAGGGTSTTGDTLVQAISSSAKRSIMLAGSAGVFYLMVPDKGIYRTTDYGANWTLWWTNALDATQSRWSGHIANHPSAPDTLWITFVSGGVWKVANANTAAVGSGEAGSVPAGAAKVTGGSLPAGTERCGVVAVDPWNNDVWVINPPNAGATITKVHRLPRGAGTTWKQETDVEVAEGAHLAQGIDAYAGMIVVATSGQGLLRRSP